jgi:hypothetical protein
MAHHAIFHPVLRILDVLSRILEFYHPRSYILCKKGVEKINILFSCCLRFQECVLRVAQFHKDKKILPKKGSGSGKIHPGSRIQSVKKPRIRIRNTAQHITSHHQMTQVTKRTITKRPRTSHYPVLRNLLKN